MFIIVWKRPTIREFTVTVPHFSESFFFFFLETRLYHFIVFLYSSASVCRLFLSASLFFLLIFNIWFLRERKKKFRFITVWLKHAAFIFLIIVALHVNTSRLLPHMYIVNELSSFVLDDSSGFMLSYQSCYRRSEVCVIISTSVCVWF